MTLGSAFSLMVSRGGGMGHEEMAEPFLDAALPDVVLDLAGQVQKLGAAIGAHRQGLKHAYLRMRRRVAGQGQQAAGFLGLLGFLRSCQARRQGPFNQAL